MWFTPLKGLGKEFRLQDYFRTTELSREDLEGYLDDYYDERGYDKQTGVPTVEKLRELGLESMALDYKV
jgi:aldehyde:ferredoxin oxidoreductase